MSDSPAEPTDVDAISGPAARPRTTRASMKRYRRAVNYLAAAQLHLRDNVLLREPLQSAHMKDRLPGHRGAEPGINLAYQHLNRLIRHTDQRVLLVTGPTHGAAANLANMYLEGSLSEFFPELSRDASGLASLVKGFGWPDALPSQLTADYPGVIHAGRASGDALSTAFGAAFDNPKLLVACVLGEGETGPTAAAWHSTKFLNPFHDGAVLPILHVHGHTSGTPSVFGSMTDHELTQLLQGHGWGVHVVSLSERLDDDMAVAMDWAHREIGKIQLDARLGMAVERPRWPMIVMKTPKNWTGPPEWGGHAAEGPHRSLQVPARSPRTDPEQLALLERWLRSFKPEELFDTDGRPAEDLLALCPRGEKRMALNLHAFGGSVRRQLVLPEPDAHAIECGERGSRVLSGMTVMGEWLRDVVAHPRNADNFRIVCPSEFESTGLGAVLEATDRQYSWPVPEGSWRVGSSGRVLEVLSEHIGQGWLQGYLLSGRHGVFTCDEAHLSALDEMVNRYAGFLKASLETGWRQPVSSLNYLLSTFTGGQECAGSAEPGPGAINNLLTREGHTYGIFLPPDAHCLLHSMHRCLASTDSINLVIAGTEPAPQWLSMEEAREHCEVGASVWSWAGTDGEEQPDVVLAGCGDAPTLEVLAAADILRREASGWRVRVVNVVDMMSLGVPQKYASGLDSGRFDRLFPVDTPVVFNFHGHTAAIKQVLWERTNAQRFRINGHRGEGSNTTPFDRQVRNQTSRYHLVIQVAQMLASRNPRKAVRAEELIVRHERKLQAHAQSIRRRGVDLAEVTGWDWSRD